MNNLPDWTTGELLYLVLVCAAFLIFSGMLMWVSWHNAPPAPDHSGGVMGKLTNFMAACIDPKGPVRHISGLATFVFIVAVIGLFIFGFNQISSWRAIIAVLIAMVVLSFIFCVYETAVTRFEIAWRTDDPQDLIRNWFNELQTQFKNQEVGIRRFQIASMKFRLCSSYLDQPDRSFASLLSLAALVDIAGAVIVTHFVITNRPIPEPVLETVIVTIPLVIISDLFGTIIGNRRPAKILIGLAIPIWFFYFPASLVVSRIADFVTRHAHKFGSDSGYG